MSGTTAAALVRRPRLSSSLPSIGRSQVEVGHWSHLSSPPLSRSTAVRLIDGIRALRASALAAQLQLAPTPDFYLSPARFAPFFEPVPPSETLYPRVIPLPLHVGVILGRLMWGHYRSAAACAADIAQIARNCETYNAAGSDIVCAAGELKLKLMELLEGGGPQLQLATGALDEGPHSAVADSAGVIATAAADAADVVADDDVAMVVEGGGDAAGFTRSSSSASSASVGTSTALCLPPPPYNAVIVAPSREEVDALCRAQVEGAPGGSSSGLLVRVRLARTS